jgi:DNA-binding IclR family transcriptional regulator
LPKTSQQDKPADGVQAVMIAIRILESVSFGDRPGRVTELARELGTSKNRIHRHLQTLVDLGYLDRDPQTQHYTVGVRLVQLGNTVTNRYDLLALSRPILRRVRDRLGDSVVLSQVQRDSVYAIDQVQGRGPVTFGITVGRPLGLHSSAQGKVLLAFGPPALLDRLLKQPLPPRTTHTIVDPERLRAEIEAVRRRGWAIAPGETMTGVAAVAVPIFDADGTLFATLATLGSSDEMPGEPDQRHIAELEAAALDISATLQGRQIRTPAAGPMSEGAHEHEA